jgi:phospholipid/cholesterol/gamma-HCH transport system substrate-binding protein
MRESPRLEIWVGAFVLIGLAAIAYLSVAIGGLSAGGPGGLEIIASFDEIGGLKSRARVVVGGVKVGQVKSVALAPDFRARVTLDVDRRLELPTDSSASILTSGVLGDQYIALEPGGGEDMGGKGPKFLAAGDEIQYTQGAVILERLIGKLIQNLGSDSSKTDASDAGPDGTTSEEGSQ